MRHLHSLANWLGKPNGLYKYDRIKKNNVMLTIAIVFDCAAQSKNKTKQNKNRRKKEQPNTVKNVDKHACSTEIGTFRAKHIFCIVVGNFSFPFYGAFCFGNCARKWIDTYMGIAYVVINRRLYFQYMYFEHVFHCHIMRRADFFCSLHSLSHHITMPK